MMHQKTALKIPPIYTLFALQVSGKITNADPLFLAMPLPTSFNCHGIQIFILDIDIINMEGHSASSSLHLMSFHAIGIKTSRNMAIIPSQKLQNLSKLCTREIHHTTRDSLHNLFNNSGAFPKLYGTIRK